MVSAVTSSSAGTAATSNGQNGSRVALDAQLSRCKQQLGDAVACASAKTPQGQQQIQLLEARIVRIQGQIVQGGEVKPPLRDQASVQPARPGQLLDVHA